MDKTLLPGSDAEDALTTGRRSARRVPIEVITRGERRRAWTADQKCEIVVESLGPELTPTEVARGSRPGGPPRRDTERLWGRLKEWQAVATRYEKLAQSFMGVLCLAATVDWIKP